MLFGEKKIKRGFHWLAAFLASILLVIGLVLITFDLSDFWHGGPEVPTSIGDLFLGAVGLLFACVALWPLFALSGGPWSALSQIRKSTAGMKAHTNGMKAHTNGMKAHTKWSNAGLVGSDIGPLKFAPAICQQSCLRSKSPGDASPERNQGQAEIAQPNGWGC